MYNEQYESAKFPEVYNSWDPPIRSDGKVKYLREQGHIDNITLYKSINISFLFQMCHVFCAQCILTNFTHISFSRQCNNFYISNWTSLRQFLTLYLLIFKSFGKLQRFHCVSIKVTSPSEPQNFNNNRQLTVKESDSHTNIQNVDCNGTKSSKH